MIKSLDIKVKALFLFILYLATLYLFNYRVLEVAFFLISIVFLLLLFYLFKQNQDTHHKIYNYTNDLYYAVFKKRIKHDNLSSVCNSLSLINSDITNKIDNIENLEKSRSKFLGNVSHEIKTPLFILQGYVDTLIGGAIHDSDVNLEFLNKIKHQSLRLNNLMEDLIKISMIESDELQLNIEKNSFKDVIEHISLNFQDVLSKRGDSLILPDIKDDIFVQIDKDNMLSVFNNIINNAINYSNDGDIIVSAKNQNDVLNIRITDHGIGMEEKYLNRIFERFYCVSSDRSRASGGTGLGLAIVKHILRAHGISIGVESRIKIGTTFYFNIPISK